MWLNNLVDQVAGDLVIVIESINNNENISNVKPKRQR